MHVSPAMDIGMTVTLLRVYTLKWIPHTDIFVESMLYNAETGISSYKNHTDSNHLIYTFSPSYQILTFSTAHTHYWSNLQRAVNLPTCVSLGCKRTLGEVTVMQR